MRPAAHTRARSASSVPARLLRAILGALILTSCSTESTIVPRRSVATEFDASALFRVGAEFSIPVDSVVVELRRSDNSLAAAKTLTAVDTTATGELKIPVTLDLKTNPESFTFLAIVYSGDVEYYRASGTVTASAGNTTTTSPITPVYTGPGANADGLTIPSATTLAGGQSATLTATVTQGQTPIAGVPIAWQSSDSSKVIPVRQGFSQAQVTAPATGSGSVTITARTPTGLSTTGTVSWTAGAATLVLISGDGQSVPVNTAAAAPLVVEARNAQGGTVPGTTVNFAVTAGPTGTSVTPTSAVTDAQGRAQTLLTAGSSQGPITVTATAAGLPPVSFTATATVPVGPAASVTANSATTQNAVANTPAGTRPSVLVRDANNLPVPNVTVTFAAAAGQGTVTGGTQTTSASGIATVGNWTMPTLAGQTVSLTATVTGLTPVTFQATVLSGPPAAVNKISGDNQAGSANAALASPLVVQVVDAFANPVANIPVAWATATGTVTPSAPNTNAAGQAQASWTLGTGATQTATATVTGIPVATFTATAGPPAINLAFVGIPDVGVGKTVQVRATLTVPAPAGGVGVTLTSDVPGTASVAAPATVTVAQGATTADFTVNGVAIGSTTLRAAATGYTAAALPIAVQDRSISVPATLNVPYNQTASLPINIGSPAPAGGVVIAVASDNPTAVGIATPNVTINAGATSANATVQGLLPGTANVTVSNPAYTNDVSVVTTSAALNVVQTSTTLNASFGIDIDIRFESNGVGIAAPAGGIPVTLTARAPTCVTSNSPRTITAGLVATTATLTAGTDPLPCTTYVVATAPNIQPDSVQVTVAATPPINVALTTQVGSGLQVTVGGSLGATNHGGTTLHVVSPDPASVLVSANSTSQGAATLDIPIPIGGSGFSFVVQALEGQTVTLPITLSAPGFVTATDTIKVVPPSMDIIFLTGSTTTFSPNATFQVRTGIANGQLTGIQAEQAVRGGAGPGLTVNVALTTVPATGVGQLVTTALTGNAVTALIAPGQSRTGGNAAAGGVEFDPIGTPGTGTISASAAGYVVLPTATQSITVTAPNINMPGAFTVGSGMQVQNSGSLGASNHGGTSVHLQLSDSVKFRLTRTTTDTAGRGSLDIPILNGSTGFSFVVQVLEGQTGTATLTATAPGFTSGSTTVTAAQPALDIIFLTGSIASLAPNTGFQVRLGLPNAGNTAIQAEQGLRAGSPGITVTVAHSNPAAGKLQAAILADTVTTQVTQLNSRNPSGAANGGVDYDPAAPGVDTVSAASPGFVVLPSARQVITVTGQAINLPGSLTLGSGMQVGTSGSLGASNYGSLTVHLEVSDSSKFLIAPNANTVGSGSLNIPMTAPTTGFSFVVQVLEGQTGTAVLRAIAPGFTTDSVQLTAVQPALDIIFLSNSFTTFSPNGQFNVRVGIPNSNNTGMQAEQVLRFGSPGVLATVVSSAPAVGAIVTKAGSGGSGTDSIVAQSARTPSGAASAGGIEFDPILGGTTTVSATIPGFIALPTASLAVTVSSPAIGMPSQTVGAGLQVGTSGSLGASNHGGVTVHVASSQPGVALVSPNGTTPGTASIDIFVPNNSSNFSYVVQGVEGATGAPAITATAPGFTDGSGVATIVTPALDIIFLSTSTTTLQPVNFFQVRIGAPNSNNTGMQAEQALRAGGTARTATVTNSNPAVGTLVFKTGEAQSGTSGIALQAARTGSDTSTGGVGFRATGAGSTTVSATIPGFIALPTASQTVSVTTPTINVSPATVGSGLQVSSSITLAAANHGGVTVHLVSSDPSKFVIAPNNTVAGTGTLDIALTNGQSSFGYVVQGLEGATGTATLTVSAPGFVTNSVTETVVQPAADIIFLPSSVSATAANDPFQIRIGIPDALGNSISAEQALRAGAATVTATVTNSNATAARLTTALGSGQSGNVDIVAGQARSGGSLATGGIEFDPLAQGSTNVSVTIPGFRVIPASTFAVTVGP